MWLARANIKVQFLSFIINSFFSLLSVTRKTLWSCTGWSSKTTIGHCKTTCSNNNSYLKCCKCICWVGSLAWFGKTWNNSWVCPPSHFHFLINCEVYSVYFWPLSQTAAVSYYLLLTFVSMHVSFSSLFPQGMQLDAILLCGKIQVFGNNIWAVS